MVGEGIMIHRRAIFTLIAVAVFSGGCADQRPTPDRALAFLEEIESKLERRESAARLASWNEFSGNQSDSSDYIRKQYVSLLSDRGTFQDIKKYRLIMKEETAARKLELLYRASLLFQIEASPEIHGLVDSMKIHSMDIDKMLDILRRLALYRNQAAKDLGYNSYYGLQLYCLNISKNLVDSLCNLLDGLSAAAYQKNLEQIKTHGEDKDRSAGYLTETYHDLTMRYSALFPADIQLSLARRTFREAGFDLNKLPVYFNPCRQSHENGFARAFAIHCPDDIRVALNLSDGYASFTELFGEICRGVYYAHIDQEEYLFRDVPSDFWAMAVCRVFGTMMLDEKWQKEYAGIPDDLIGNYKVYVKDSLLYYVRLKLMHIEMEKELYLNPVIDPKTRYRDLFQEYMLQEPPEEDAASWIAGMIARPLSWLSELLADLIAAQILACAEKDGKTILDDPSFSFFMEQNIFRFGRRYDWESLLKWATGEGLKPEHYLNMPPLSDVSSR
jgi:hypothetical protein